MWLLADAPRLRQVVGNLLSNAIKFTDAGAVALEYGAGVAEKGRRTLTLVVADTGVGIPANWQASLSHRSCRRTMAALRRHGSRSYDLQVSRHDDARWHRDAQ